jgi:hypothetical protein
MRGNKGVVGLALVTALALAFTVGTGASASGELAHTAGLKGCLQKANKIQDPVKRKKAKKKCRKKFATAPLVRATLSWSGGAGNTDYDLYVFLNGTTARAASNPIPNTSFSANAKGQSGTESFTDLVYSKAGARDFQFGVCYQDGGSNPVTYHIDYVTADGVHHTDSQTGEEGFNARYSGGAPALNTFTCPAL